MTLEDFEKQVISSLSAKHADPKPLAESLLALACDCFGLSLVLSFNMPSGYETANALFDPVVSTVYCNPSSDSTTPVKLLFFFLHELRHALQAFCPHLFSESIRLNNRYVIQYDGTAYRLSEGEWQAVKLGGEEDYYTELYLASPGERDANAFAYRCLNGLYGKETDDLFAAWTPQWRYFSEGEAEAEFLKAVTEIDRLIP